MMYLKITTKGSLTSISHIETYQLHRFASSSIYTLPVLVFSQYVRVKCVVLWESSWLTLSQNDFNVFVAFTALDITAILLWSASQVLRL